MIIPMQCFSCGKNISNLWEIYQKKLQDEYNKKQLEINSFRETFHVLPTEKTPEEKILNELGVNRYCCRRMILGNLDLYEKI